MLTKRTLFIAFGVVILLIAGTIFSNVVSSTKSKSNYPSTTEENAPTAPDFSLLNTEEELVNLSDFKGKVIILNFWATWCGPCKMEIPGFVKLQKKYKDDLVIIGISLDQRGENVVLPFIERFGINYPILYGDSKVIRDYGGIQGIPTTFVIDRNLVIQRKYIGYRSDELFKKDIEEFI
ncbi:MAG: TlpA family protein disulfide reductase [Candidatus Marinimicrobia bacterium]|nr:TlpA family protein disulfide reductase [Candidatus Neomarinimicrobiota bacterium]